MEMFYKTPFSFKEIMFPCSTKTNKDNGCCSNSRNQCCFKCLNTRFCNWLKERLALTKVTGLLKIFFHKMESLYEEPGIAYPIAYIGTNFGMILAWLMIMEQSQIFEVNAYNPHGNVAIKSIDMAVGFLFGLEHPVY